MIDTTFTITTSTWLLAIVIAAADVKPAMTGTDMKSIKNPSLVKKRMITVVNPMGIVGGGRLAEV